jgi:hypothetical protein
MEGKGIEKLRASVSYVRHEILARLKVRQVKSRFSKRYASVHKFPVSTDK